MKKIIFVASLVVFLSGCNLDINTDPDHPSTVSSILILPSAENFIAQSAGNLMYNYAGFFAQYYEQMPEAGQYTEISEYSFKQSSQLIDRAYLDLYAGALMDLQQILNDNSVTTADKYVATVLRAYSFQLLVDNTSQTPYTEALHASQPKSDKGEDVYKGVLDEMDKAEAALSNSSITCNDLIFSKDLSQWKGFANALRLRMYLRFIDANVDTENYTSKLKTLVNAGNFFTGDVEYAPFSDEEDKRNPWYTTNSIKLASNHCASYPIVSYLLATKDPRIAYDFKKATATDSYAGELPGSRTELTNEKKNKDYSALNYYPTKPVYFFTQSELQFMLAESYIRFFDNDAKAKSAYEAGIDADFLARDIDNPSQMYGTNGPVAWSTATTNPEKLELIYMQKWVALCYMDHMEAWSEIRRTDCPSWSSKTATKIYADPTIYTAGQLIVPMRNSLDGTNVVKRMWFCQTAKNLNPNTPDPVPVTTPVWWDIK